MGSIEQTNLRHRLYIAGSTGGSSIAPPAHNFIAEELGKESTMEFLKAKTSEAVMEVFRRPDFAGGVVTMPHKKAIIPYLDEVDDLVMTIGACNVVYLTADEKLHGTNTDWAGILESLLLASPRRNQDCAMVYGAGGASRAAIYALAVKLGYHHIYIVNRDEAEVADLQNDMRAYQSSIRPTLTHVRSTTQAKGLPTPACIVSTVPDFEPKYATEIEAQSILAEFLSRSGSDKGVLLDMCYHPRITRNIRIALDHRWTIVEGIQVVAHQLKLQWMLWTGKKLSIECERDAIAVLQRCADENPAVTPGRVQV